ncbi:MAG: hypothetical protein H0V82_12865 [Candidatus Protochlamydia sp.]|nr:hypothetical protein [Candidatus Protochlamydia sp.]
MDLIIDGIGIVPSNRAEYTSGAVLKKYLDNVAILKEIFAKRGATPLETLQASDYDDALLAMTNLRNLALNGSTDGNPPLTFYMTAEMGIDLDLLFKSLRAAGITIDNPITNSADKVTLLGNWQSLAGFGVQAIVNAAASVSTNSTRTLQSMVELEYVKAGNELLADKLSTLEQSLRTTQAILDRLAIIQGISNQITVTNRGDFAFPPNNTNQIPSGAVAGLQNVFQKIASGQNGAIYTEMKTFAAAYAQDLALAKSRALTNKTTLSTELALLTGASTVLKHVLEFDWGSTAGKGANTQAVVIQKYTQIYQIMASAQFRQVFPVASPTNTAATELLAVKQKLYQDLINLEQISPNNTRSVEGTLANFVYKVTLDISNAFKNITMTAPSAQLALMMKSAVSTWILDNQDQKVSSTLANNVGKIQDRITQAITAAESLNNVEKQNVANFQFMFQQFYTSASTVLQKVTQIIEKMAQKIGQ